MSFYQTQESVIPPAPLTGCSNTSVYGASTPIGVIGVSYRVVSGIWAGERTQLTLSSSIPSISTWVTWSSSSNDYLTVRSYPSNVIIASGFANIGSPLTLNFTSVGIYMINVNLNGFPTCSTQNTGRDIWVKRIS